MALSKKAAVIDLLFDCALKRRVLSARTCFALVIKNRSKVPSDGIPLTLHGGVSCLHLLEEPMSPRLSVLFSAEAEIDSLSKSVDIPHTESLFIKNRRLESFPLY